MSKGKNIMVMMQSYDTERKLLIAHTEKGSVKSVGLYPRVVMRFKLPAKRSIVWFGSRYRILTNVRLNDGLIEFDKMVNCNFDDDIDDEAINRIIRENRYY